MKKINTTIILILFNILLNNNYLYSKNSNELYEKIDLFGEVLETIKQEYVDEVNQIEVMDSAINGVLQSLDPYSAYMSPKSFKGMQTDTKGEFGGLGIEIGMESGVIKVIAPIDDTPAANVGIKSGDYIIRINNIQVQGKSLTEAVELMRGPIGSEINLTIRRKNKKKALEFKIKRAIIEVKSVETKIIGEQKEIGYLRLKSFNENSDKQLFKIINGYEKNNKLTSYILDLRNNPGGLLNQAISITDFFLDDGEIVSTKGRKISETRRFFSKKGDGINKKPLIVITNNGSASASEIVSGALKDHKRAIILGERTYGKGSVQSIIPLKNGGGIRLTISKYYLPSGKSISEIGVLPDIFVEEIGDNFKINTETDNQLKHAINLLKS
ncbi:S41 family peptidase [Pelagibacteraceae bacterium]|jgi:carboxyl-terminal processing protease|nr:S41 family peptidase [Pelagibacteraceae bacterium]